MKDFINLSDFDGAVLGSLLDRAIADKAAFRAGELPASLSRRVLGMIFQKASLRTRVSFEAAMTHLGGHAVYLTRDDIGLGKREAVQDIARVLSRMCDAVCVRTYSHEWLEDLARSASAPVINALTDHSHPCQAMADLMTVLEHFGELAGRTVAFVGDGNNVARSLAVACKKLGMRFILAAPKGYELTDPPAGEAYRVTAEAAAAVADADVICTDTWVSMGQEEQRRERLEAFQGFQLNADLLARAPGEAIVLHCLPAYRGFEITDEVFEAHAESILAESENRLHFQRTLLNVLVAEGGL